MFWNIYSDDLLDIITTQTKTYAIHKGLNPPATSEEIKVALNLLLLSSYCRVPWAGYQYRELYWTTSPDTHNDSVSKAMSRNCFWEIFSNLHIQDNTDMDNDRYYKVRPLFDILNRNFKSLYLRITLVSIKVWYHINHIMVDMVRSSLLEESPFGYKLWCLCSSYG